MKYIGHTVKFKDIVVRSSLDTATFTVGYVILRDGGIHISHIKLFDNNNDLADFLAPWAKNELKETLEDSLKTGGNQLSKIFDT